MTNREFFEKHARSGAIGLVGSSAAIDRAIRRAQKRITKNKQASLFSHAFLISEKRIDGEWWVIESDLEIHSKQVKLGVQENRLSKYFDEKLFPNVALLDFNLDKAKTQLVLKEALDMVAGRAKYSLREIMGVFFSFQSEAARKKENILKQDHSFICSSFVQHCYHKAGVGFSQAVSLKNITPEDIYTTEIVHAKHKIIREQ
jgi:hypothetical protein